MNATTNISRKDKLPRTLFSVSLWVVPLIMLPLFLLTTCTQFFSKLDNPTDPSSSNYQGYSTVTTSSAIVPGSPFDGGNLTSSTLTISKVTNAIAYELVLATSSEALMTNSIFDKNNYNSNVMDISAAPLADSTIYYWHGRTKDSNGIWGEWSNSFSFTKIVVITTVAGNGTSGFSGDGGTATSAELQNPQGIALDSSGNLYIADYNNNCVRKINTSTGIITTVAGKGTSGNYSGDGGAATSARLVYPSGVAIDSADNLYIADYGSNCIRKITASTGIITTVAGKFATYGHSGDGGAATSATFWWPIGIAIDSSDNLYIADSGNNCIRKITASTGIITTVAGNGPWDNSATYGSTYSGDGGAATSAELCGPCGIALDALGNLYISDTGNYRIRKVTASTGIITTVAGIGEVVDPNGVVGATAVTAVPPPQLRFPPPE